MSADWSKPVITDTYANVLTYIGNRLNDAALLFDSSLVAGTNLQVGTKRWNASTSKWEAWSGTAWGDMAATYAISISGNAATATTAGAAPWSGITGKPTTLTGYGISSADTLFDSKYATPASVNSAVDALKDVAPNPKSTSYTLALTDRGMSIDTSAGVTVPLNSAVAFPVGSTVSVTNTSSVAITVTQTAGVTLRQAGTVNTGNRTLAGYGVATLRKIATDTWILAGAGVT